HLGSSGCQRIENLGFCPSNWECSSGKTEGAVVADVFWLYHSSRSAISNSRLYAPGKFHAGLLTGIRTSWQVVRTSRLTREASKSVEPIVSNDVFSESGLFLHRSPWYSTPAANETGPAGRLNRSPSRWKSPNGNSNSPVVCRVT